MDHLNYRLFAIILGANFVISNVYSSFSNNFLAPPGFIVQDNNPFNHNVSDLDRIRIKVWNNILANNLLTQIVQHSVHATDEKVYGFVDFWGDLTIHSELLISIHIKQKVRSRAFVTPKLHRITTIKDEQIILAKKIWEGITNDDIMLIAKKMLEEYDRRRKKGWLTTDHRIIIEELYPSFLSGNIDIRLIPTYAQITIAVKRKQKRDIRSPERLFSISL